MRLAIPPGTGSAPPPTLTYDQTVLADTPVGFWPLNESSGTTAHDQSGNANDGTLSGSFSLGATGIGDGETACTFTGGKLAIADAAPLRLGAGAISVEFCANFSTLGSYACVFDNTGRSYSLFLNAGAAADVFVGLGTLTSGYTIGTTPATGNLYHIVLTANGSTAIIYINAVAYSHGFSSGVNNSSTGVTFFGNPSGGGAVPQGTASKLAVYNYVLTPTQVTAHHAAM